MTLEDARILAKTKSTGLSAVGAAEKPSNALSVKLAEAVSKFHGFRAPSDIVQATKDLHHIVLTIRGELDLENHDVILARENFDHLQNRLEMLGLLEKMSFTGTGEGAVRAWLNSAKETLEQYTGVTKLGHKLRFDASLQNILDDSKAQKIASRTIHEVKGMEFDAVCVVLTSTTAKSILDHIIDGSSQSAEEARLIYVAASRAKRALMIACPKSQATRLKKHLLKFNVPVTTKDI